MSQQQENQRAAQRARNTSQQDKRTTQRSESAQADANRHAARAQSGRHSKCGAPNCAGCS